MCSANSEKTCQTRPAWPHLLARLMSKMGDVIRKTLYDRVLRTEKDSHGNQIIVTRGADGQEQRGYVNVPGLDGEDVARGVRGRSPTWLQAALPVRRLKEPGSGSMLCAGVSRQQEPALPVTWLKSRLARNRVLSCPRPLLLVGLERLAPWSAKVAGALWNRFVTVPGLCGQNNRTTNAKGHRRRETCRA